MPRQRRGGWGAVCGGSAFGGGAGGGGRVFEERRGPGEAAEPLRRASADEYQQRAQDLVQAFDAKDEAALQRVNAFYGRSFSLDDLWAEVWRRVYAFRQRAFNGAPQQLMLAEAQASIS